MSRSHSFESQDGAWGHTLADVRRRRGTLEAFAEVVEWCGKRARRMLALRAAPRPSSAAFLVVVADVNGNSVARERTLASLRRQAHRRWRVAESTDGGRRLVKEAELVVLVTAGDVLHAHALGWLAEAAARQPLVDVFYTDEESFCSEQRIFRPFVKPAWSPDLLHALPYVLHALCVRGRLYAELGGPGAASDEAAHYAFALRATAGRHVARVPRVLCRRTTRGLEPAVGLTVLRKHAAGLEPPADAEPGAAPGTFRLVRPSSRPPVTLVVLTRDALVDLPGRGQVRVFAEFVTSIVARTTYPDWRLLVVDDGGLCPASLAAVERAGARRITYSMPGAEFNFSDKVGFALPHVETEYFVLLNDDLEVIEPGWLEALVDYLVEPGVGIVGGKLIFADGRTQHAGVIAAGADGPTHRLYDRPADADDGHGPADVVRDLSAVTAAVMASRLDVVRRAGGFDPAFPRDYNDVDFCLRVRAAGFRVVYTPFALLYHFERSSLAPQPPAHEDLRMFRRRWGAWCRLDPYYPPGDF